MDIKDSAQLILDTTPSDVVRAKLFKATIEKYGEDHWESLVNIIDRESKFNPFAVNPTSGACGLFQRYPCNSTLLATCGSLSNIDCQIQDGLNYFITHGYGSPNGAWAYWQANGSY